MREGHTGFGVPFRVLAVPIRATKVPTPVSMHEGPG
jgi:hypothetical protein